MTPVMFQPAESRRTRNRWYSVDGKSIDVIALKSGALMARITGIPVFHQLRFSNDGRRLAATQYNETILVWDIEQLSVEAPANSK